MRPATNRPRYLVDDPLNRTKIIKEEPAKAEGRQAARPEDRKAAQKPSPKTACDALGGEWHSGTLEQVRQIVKDWQKTLSRCTAGTDDCRTYRGGLSIQSYMKILTVWQCHVTFFSRAKTASKDDRKKAHEEACAIESTLEKIAEQIKATGIMKAGASWKPYHIDIRDKLGMKGTCAPGQFKEAGGHYRKDPKSAASSIAEAKPKKKCRDGGLLGAMNCVTSKIEGAGSGPGKPPASASAREPATGITTRSERNRDGSRTITRTDKNGKVLSTETVGKGQASASSTDPATGITTRSEQNPDGTRTVTRTDKSGNVLSREKIGKRPASASATDKVTGTITTSVANPDGTRTITKTDAQGNVLSREKVR